MVALIDQTNKSGRSKPEEREICGMKVISILFHSSAEQREGRKAKQLLRMEQKLLRAGANAALCMPDFCYKNRLSRLKPVDPHPLYYRMADRIILAWMDREKIDPHTGCVALSGNFLSPQLAYTARSLCRSVREIKIDVPGKAAEAFAKQLHWEFGIPILPPSVPAEFTASFSGDPAAQLCFGIETPKLDGLTLAADGINLPESVEIPFLYLLWERGMVDLRQIKVIKYAKKTHETGKVLAIDDI